MYLKVQTYFVVLLVTFIAGAAGDYCFRNRAAAGPFGRCNGMISNINTARQCCRAGGAGWTEKQSGKRCGPACSGRPNEPTTVPPVEESTTTQPPAEVKLCFRNREPRGMLGGCDDLIGERTREDCCRQGGRGWTDRPNGKRCEDVCQGVDPGPVHHCFRRRSRRGRCSQSLGEKTRLQCCQDGGAGWSHNSNGRNCESACEEPPLQVIHGGWSEWEDWSQCSVSCEEGIQTRRRRCNNPAPENGGDECDGPNSEEAICDEGPCPIDGGWGPWRNAGECSATCYYEERSVYRSMRRRCNNPPPQFGGNDCRGPSRKNVVCLELPHCPVDGGWSDYGEWSECSQTCEEGIQTRIRTCTNPPPQYGGRECDGEDRETQICRNRRVCPVHGGWSDWGPWSPCDSPRCGVEGTKFRTRDCDNPKPKNRGNYCIGLIVDRQTCSKCTVAGGWSEWSSWGSCSGNCLRGDFRERRRICNNPPPQNGGSCEGDFRQYGECEGLDPCPNGGEGSGSGNGGGSGDIFPCDDEDDCNYGGGNDDDEDDENSFSYSNYNSFVVQDDVTPTPEPCEDFDYSVDYYDQVECQPQRDVNDANDDSSSIDYDNDNSAFEEEPNGGQSTSYSYDDPLPPQVDENNGDRDSYSFDEVEDNAGNSEAQQDAPQVEQDNGDSYSYSFDDVEDNADPVEAGEQSAANGQDDQQGDDSYSVSV